LAAYFHTARPFARSVGVKDFRAMTDRDLFDGARILVTGATGLYGRALVDRLVAMGAIVRAVSRTAPRLPLPYGVEHVAGSLAEPQFADRVCQGIDGLFHCAGLRGSIAIQLRQATDLLAGNIAIDFNTLEAARRAAVPRVVYVSSITVHPPMGVYREELAWTANPDPGNQFVAWAKRMAEKLVEAQAVQYGDERTAIVRPVNSFGPYDDFDPATALVVAALIRRVMDGQDPLVVWGDGSAVRDFLYVDDVVDGMVLAYRFGLGKGPINIGTGTGCTIRELVTTVVAASGKSPRIEWDPSRPSGEPCKIADITRARELLGFAPRVSLADGVARTTRWLRDVRAPASRSYAVT
jgi:GDP-L-fucose synthase